MKENGAGRADKLTCDRRIDASNVYGVLIGRTKEGIGVVIN